MKIFKFIYLLFIQDETTSFDAETITIDSFCEKFGVKNFTVVDIQ